MKDTIDWSYPRVVRRYGDMLAILAEQSKGSKETEIKVATRVRGLANSMKNRQGVARGGQEGQAPREEGCRRGRAPGLDRRRLLPEEEVRRRSSPPSTICRRSARRSGSGTRPCRPSTPTPPCSARRAPSGGSPRSGRSPTPTARPSTSSATGSGCASRRSGSSAPSTSGADRALLRYALLEAAALPAGAAHRGARRGRRLTAGLTQAESTAKVDGWLATLYGTPSKLADQTARLALFDGKPEEVLAAKDPFLDLAAALAPLDKQIRDADKARDGRRVSRSARSTCRPCSTRRAACVAPDANSTLRVTFGTVKGVSPQDGVLYLPQTTLQGVVAKAKTGDPEFDAPPALLAAAAKVLATGKGPFVDPKLGDVPVELPLRRRHHRRQLRLGGAERQGEAGRACSSTEPTRPSPPTCSSTRSTPAPSRWTSATCSGWRARSPGATRVAHGAGRQAVAGG